MKLALLLPQFAPNLHDLAAMLQADQNILQDNETWSRKSRTHRARIRTDGGTQWINIPVQTEDRNKAVNQVRIDHQRKWIKPLLRTLRFNYNKSIYFDFYQPKIETLFRASVEYDYLLPFIRNFQHQLFQLLHVEIDYRLASDLPNYTSDPDELGRRLNADQLFQEYSSRHYQRQAKHKSEPVFNHPTYYQHFNGFKPDCCLLDVLFQLGPESFRIIDKLYH